MISGITIFGGTDKSGAREKVQNVHIASGEIMAVVGPTGSGKTQLISDIEQYWEEETLSRRRIYIEGMPETGCHGMAGSRYLIAQVSQNMNFVIDTSIEEFIRMHSQVRGIKNPTGTIAKVLEITNYLSGEPVTLATNLTQLSGGQSRALMVADVAVISNAPIVLIDEIENAGIDRMKALEILSGHGKIILVVSHDPTLMLMAKQRIVMKNGGMEKVCNTSPEEARILKDLLSLEKDIGNLREQLRKGNIDVKEETDLWQEFSFISR